MKRRLLMMLAQRLLGDSRRSNRGYGRGHERGYGSGYTGQGYRANGSDYPDGRPGQHGHGQPGQDRYGHPGGHDSGRRDQHARDYDPNAYRRHNSPLGSEAQRLARELWPVLNTPRNRALAKELLKRARRR